MNPVDGIGFVSFLIFALATGRVTRFIVSDDLWKELREGIVRKLQDPRVWTDQDKDPIEDVEFKARRNKYLQDKLATLITCPWCVSIYVAAAVLGLSNFAWFDWVAVFLALSMGATLFIEFTDGVKQVQSVLPAKQEQQTKPH